MTLLEKSGIMWSHTRLETFYWRKCKGLWETNDRCVLRTQDLPFKSKNCTLDILHPSALLSFTVCLQGFFFPHVIRFWLLLNPVWENCRIHHFKLFYNQNNEITAPLNDLSLHVFVSQTKGGSVHVTVHHFVLIFCPPPFEFGCCYHVGRNAKL